jgi:hypothetical protein
MASAAPVVPSLIMPQNRIWGQRNNYPRIIRDIELSDIFSVQPQLNLLNQSQRQQAVPYMRMLLSTRLMNRSEYASLRQQLEYLRGRGGNFISIGQMLILRSERILRNAHQFPALLTTAELARCLKVSGDISRFVNEADTLLGGGSAAAGAAGAGRTATATARGSFAGAIVGYVGYITNATANHYGSYERAYALEMTRRGIYVR